MEGMDKIYQTLKVTATILLDQKKTLGLKLSNGSDTKLSKRDAGNGESHKLFDGKGNNQHSNGTDTKLSKKSVAFCEKCRSIPAIIRQKNKRIVFF